MSWEDLFDLIKTIPEHRRTEQAVFLDPEEGETRIIDNMEERDLMDDTKNGIIYDCTVGDDSSLNTYALTP